MNVGPTARGTWDERARQALMVYRDWMAINSDAIYGCTQSEFTPPQDCRLTQNGTKLYVHVYAWPDKFLFLPGLANRVKYAQFLHDGSEITMDIVPPQQLGESQRHEDSYVDGGDPMAATMWQQTQYQVNENTLLLTLPVKKPDVVVPVIELTLA